MTSPASSFRDPSGYVEFTSREVVRHIHPQHAEQAFQFLRSSIAQAWQSTGQMISGEIDADALIVRHPRLFFPSYPWEWAPRQWQAAAQLTLDLCKQAIPAGFLLKDATPLNILFEGPRPVFVDVLSFDPRDSTNPIWLAQGQFIRTFLLPLLASRHLGWPLAVSQIYRDGYEPSQLLRALSIPRRLHPKLLWPITLPALLEQRSAPVSTHKPQRNPELVSAILSRNIRRLSSQIDKAVPSGKSSRWSGYVSTAAHYSDEDHARKKELVGQVLQTTRPETVLDIGANTGTYSLLAANSGARVVALDTDETAIDLLWARASQESHDILPLVVNIARPTPALGWENAESLSFLDRAKQKFELVMMLAVVHHLLLMDQIPLERIAAAAAALTSRDLLLEWVPQSDPMFQRMMCGRDSLYAELTEERMLRAFSMYFSPQERWLLANGRTLHRMKKI